MPGFARTARQLRTCTARLCVRFSTELYSDRALDQARVHVWG